MTRTAWWCVPAVLAALCLGPARAEKKPASRDALALQEALQAVIDDVEPSVACILVSRSPRYQEFGEAPSPDRPGVLGDFDYTRVPSPDFRDNKSPRRLLAEKLDLSVADNVPESFGSGLVIDEKAGLVLTNYHVVRGATKLYVRLPGGKGSYANVLAADPRSDLAVLDLIKKDGLVLKEIKLGDGGKARKGQMVLAIANPFAAGFRDGSPSASWGIISNVRRRTSAVTKEEERTRSLHHYGTLLQTDVRLNLGCSGGALVDLHGEVIGLTSSLAGITGSDVPGGFAVPFDAGMRRIVDVLKKGEEVNYGFLGVSFYPPPSRERGVRLFTVSPGSPAAEAGLQPEDVIRSINDTPVENNDDMFRVLGTCQAGDEIKLGFVRAANGVREQRKARATLAKFAVTGPIIARNRPSERGLRVDYTSLLVQSQGRQRVPRGVLVREVLPTSPFANTMLKVGDVITQVNDKPVTTPGQFYRLVKGIRGPVELTIEGTGTRVRSREPQPR